MAGMGVGACDLLQGLAPDSCGRGETPVPAPLPTPPAMQVLVLSGIGLFYSLPRALQAALFHLEMCLSLYCFVELNFINYLPTYCLL